MFKLFSDEKGNSLRKKIETFDDNQYMIGDDHGAI